MRSYISIALIVFFSTSLYAQKDCACCTDNHKQFDFWIGDWMVYDTTGKKIGENQILKLEEDCIISEHWKGATGMTGRSYNYYNTEDETWNQVWIDNKGTNLVLKGKAEENKMILSSKLTKGKDNKYHINRITWTKNKDGSVTQEWDVLDRNQQVINSIFKGIYKKK